MKKFLTNIGLFVVVVVLTAIVADVMVNKGLEKTERGRLYTMNALMNQTLNADVVILGNSRAESSYNPRVMDSVLGVNCRNLGVAGQPFSVSYLRWQLYRRNNNSPKVLIINIGYKELDEIFEGFSKEQYYPYVRDPLVKPYLDPMGFTWFEKHLPMYRYRGDYKLIGIGLTELLHIRHDTKGNYYKGYYNPNVAWQGIRFADMLQNGKEKCQANMKVIDMLDDVLKTAQRERLRVVFVYAPIYSEFKRNLDEKEVLDVFAALSNCYGIPILDFSDTEMCSDTTCFSDAYHVNARGAFLFSVKLARAMDSLGFLQN